MEPLLNKPISNGESMPRRSIIPSLFALGKKHLSTLLSSIARTEVFQVRLDREQKYLEYLGRIANKVDALSTAIKNFPKIEMKGTPASLQIQTMSEETIGQLTHQLDEVKKAVLSNRPQGFPQVQKVMGDVRVTNQKDFPLERVLSALSSIEETIRAIKLESPKAAGIKFPEFPKQVSFSESKEILRALQDLRKGIETLPKKFPEIDFPGEVRVTNFPPQPIPTPVTNININPLRGFVKSRNITVTNALTPLPDEVLAYRRSLIVFNNDATVTLFLGGSDVTSTNGLPILAQTYSPVIDAGPRMILYGITASASINVRVMELSNENVGG